MPCHHSPETCRTEALANAQAVCAEQGVRFTDLRRQVLELIWASHSSTKAYELMDQLRSGDDAAKPPTVYRTLDFLQEHGLVHKLNSLNAYVGCHHPQAHHACYFLICTGCETVEECCNDSLTHAISETTESSHFTPTRTTLEIEGLCRTCTEKAS